MISTFEIALALWRRKIALIFLFIAGTCLGVLVCVYAPRVYEAETLILIRKPGPSMSRASGATDPAIVHTRILASPEVIDGAVTDVALDPNEDRSPAAYMAKVLKLLGSMLGWQQASSLNQTTLAAMRNLRIGIDPGGEIIRVKFRYGTPQTAASFLNAVSLHYAKRLQQISQWRDSDAIAERENELISAYKKAYDELTEFSSRTKVYSSDEQQRLAIKRKNDLTAAIADARSSIEDKRAQLATYPDQLSKMKPLARVLGASDIVGPVTTDKRKKGLDAEDVTSNTPPLLLQRVYQDTVQTVVKLRTELAGLEMKLDQLHREQENVDSELNSLARHEAEYNKLEFQVSQTRNDAEAYTKWVTDQRSLSALPEIQILQAASPPFCPTFPRPELVVPFFAFLSVLLGASTIVAGHAVNTSNAFHRRVHPLTPMSTNFIAADLPAPPVQNWKSNIKKIESSSLIKQLGSGAA